MRVIKLEQRTKGEIEVGGTKRKKKGKRQRKRKKNKKNKGGVGIL